MTDTFRLDEVDDLELLWRRVHQSQFVPDGEGGMKVSSAAFTDPNLSVDRAWIVIAAGGDVSTTRQDGVGVAQFSAGFARSLDQEVDPDPVEGNDAHALVKGDKRRGNRRVAKRLAEVADFLD